jgi:hypothetical protein
MAISNELSSEIAMALLANQERSPEELNNLKTILLVVHSTLQSLSEDAHRLRTEEGLPAKAASGRD